MSSLAPLLERFFSERLLSQRRASPNTVAAYRDTFRLLLRFIDSRDGTKPSAIQIENIDANLVSAFLSHLERDRKNSVRTRNARLAAIHSFFHFIAFETPEHSAQIQRVLAIPQKRAETKIISYLEQHEVDALLASVDQCTALGRRDYALLLLAIETGMRVSELIGLRWRDVSLGRAAHVRCIGKGRKERCTPLSSAAIAALRGLAHNTTPQPETPVFVSRREGPMSRDAVERLLTKYANAAASRCGSLKKKRLSPHSLRHTSAMRLVNAGVERTVIALWLGHESIETTEVYVHADMKLKEKAIRKTAQHPVSHRRFRPPDRLLAFLEAL
jgi:site-specific recombinase XerD